MHSESGAPKRIVILGSGFGGLYTALHLEKKLRNTSGVEVTLVNRENFFLFTPMLHEVAAGDLDVTHIVNPVRKLLRRTQFFNAQVKSIDLKKRIVAVVHAGDAHVHEIVYDYLVLALGSVTNFYNLPGLNGHRPSEFQFKTIGALASIGKRTGVARILGINFSGFLAWWLWRTIYLSKLSRFEKKLRVALDWLLDLLFSKDLVQYIDENVKASRADAPGSIDKEAAEAQAV
jgi:NADH dehydrogenase FAD-containing subunit